MPALKATDESVDIVDSLRFYIMLSIVYSNSKYAGSESVHSLNIFVSDLKRNSHYSTSKINFFIRQAYRTIPTEFRQIFQIPAVGVY